jgi:hypothetical protein
MNPKLARLLYTEEFSSAMGYAGVQNSEWRYLEDSEEDNGEGDEDDSSEDKDEEDDEDEDEMGEDTDNENNIEYAYGDDYFNVDHGAYYTDEILSVNSATQRAVKMPT